MSPQDFLAHFHEIANAPGGVARLRELIRSLAIRGQLVEHVTGSVDPDSIRVFVDAERQSLVEQGLLRPTKKERTKSYPQRSSWLPEHWTIMPLGEVTVSVTDGDHLPPPKAPQGFPFLVISDVRWGKIDFDDCRLVTSEYFQKLDWIRKPIEGDLLFTLVGSFGIPVIVGDIQPFCVQRHIGIIKPSSVIDVAYLACALGSADLFQQVSRMATGTAQKTVPLLGLRLLPIPLPPLAEQKRIVAKVEELMALCDALEAQQQERARLLPRLSRATHTRLTDSPTQPHLDSLFTDLASVSPEDMRRTILSLAVQGVLVPQNPADESADLLIESIQQTNSKPTNRRVSNRRDLSIQEPFPLPPGWAWARFPDLGEFGRGKSKHRPRNDTRLYTNGTYRLVQTGDVARAHGTILSHTGLYNEVGLAQSKLWPEGTLCITIAANIADSGVLGFDACFPDSVVGFVPSKKLPSVRYFEYFMRTAKEAISKFAPATAQKNINLGILEQVQIPIPPANEQRRIVAKVDELMALVDTLEAQQQEKSRLAETFAKTCATSLTTIASD